MTVWDWIFAAIGFGVASLVIVGTLIAQDSFCCPDDEETEE